MFKSTKIPCYVKSCKMGGDADSPTLHAKFCITPARYSLIAELSERIADQLFSKEGAEEMPVQELGLTVLNLGGQGVLNAEIYPHAEASSDGAGQMIAGVKIGKISVDKVIPEDPNWSLIFEVIMPLDSVSLELMRKYYNRTLHLTLLSSQEKLFNDDVPQLCKVCAEPATCQLDGIDQYVCDKHALEGDVVRRLK